MPFTNFPGGVASFGMPVLGAGRLYDMPCGEVIFVCNRSGVINGDGSTRDKPMLSIADAIVAINTTVASTAATIVVLAGHAENVTGSNTFSASLVNTGAVVIPAGTRIVGEGFGNLRPTLTFTAAGSTIAFAAASCSIENMFLRGPQTGVTTVAAMFTVTAAWCMIRACDWQLATSATALVTTGVSLSSAASFFRCLDCPSVTATTGTPTSWISTTGTTGPNQVTISRNNCYLPLTATTSGCVDFSANSVAGPLNVSVIGNSFINATAASTVAIKFSASATGLVAYNSLGTTNASATACMGTTTLLQLVQNFVSQPNKFGLIAAAGGAST